MTGLVDSLLVRACAALAACLAVTGCVTSAPAVHRHRVAPPPEHVILISIDGLRFSDLGGGDTPTLDRLARDGASGPMRPAFPNLTFPNHWTLVTGLDPDRHGIVANSFRDPSLGDFQMTETGEAFWRGAEPIWISAERAGVRTATMFWPGSETAFGGIRPSQWRPFDRDLPELARTKQVLTWLDLPAGERPRLVTLYFNAVDRGPALARSAASEARTAMIPPVRTCRRRSPRQGLA